MIQLNLAARPLALLVATTFFASCSGSSVGPAPPIAGVVPAAAGALPATQSRSLTAQGEKKQTDAPEITVAPTSLTFVAGGAPQTFTATTAGGHVLNSSSSNTACATVFSASLKPTRLKHEDQAAFTATFTVTPVGAGDCTITVTGKHDKDQSATVAVHVVGPLSVTCSKTPCAGTAGTDQLAADISEANNGGGSYTISLGSGSSSSCALSSTSATGDASGSASVTVDTGTSTAAATCIVNAADAHGQSGSITATFVTAGGNGGSGIPVGGV